MAGLWVIKNNKKTFSGGTEGNGDGVMGKWGESSREGLVATSFDNFLFHYKKWNEQFNSWYYFDVLPLTLY